MALYGMLFWLHTCATCGGTLYAQCEAQLALMAKALAILTKVLHACLQGNVFSTVLAGGLAQRLPSSMLEAEPISLATVKLLVCMAEGSLISWCGTFLHDAIQVGLLPLTA